MKIKRKTFNKWFNGTDCYGNRIVNKLEKSHIEKRLKKLDKDIIFDGDIEKDELNSILVDITYLKDDDFQPNKKVLISLAHFVRPCLCDKCKHKNQYECYLMDCNCCSEDCT